MIYFALNDAETGKEITSSDLLFDPKFFEEKFPYIYDECINEAVKYLNEQEINFAKQIYIWVLSDSLFRKRKEYRFTNFDTQGDQNKYFRVREVRLHLEQFVNREWYYNATSKLNSLLSDYHECGEDIYIKGLYYFDVERIDGMDSMLRELMMSIKGFQRPDDMKLMIKFAFKEKAWKINDFIERKNIDCLCIIPNNVSRRVSFNTEIQEFLIKSIENIQFLNINVHDFEWRKPQKATRGLCERIKNADQLFTVDALENGIIPKRILLIDDVFWSWATMNMIAKKIKHIYPDVEIFGFAILWSYRKGFDVINEI